MRHSRSQRTALETTKRLCDDLVTEAGVGVRLHSTVTRAVWDGRGRVREVTVNSRGGDETITAPAFVDTTGHAAGIAAAHYARDGQHDIEAVRAELRRQNALI
ncbi:FAD-dependent oxidoreductase [Streptomyces asiaticus]